MTKKSPGVIADAAIVNKLYDLVLAKGEDEVAAKLGISPLTVVRTLARLPVMRGSLAQVTIGLASMPEPVPARAGQAP